MQLIWTGNACSAPGVPCVCYEADSPTPLNTIMISLPYTPPRLLVIQLRRPGPVGDAFQDRCFRWQHSLVRGLTCELL